MWNLRPYQHTIVESLREVFRRGHQRTVLYAPTGSGKTVMAGEVIRLSAENGTRVLFLAHRRELVFQASRKLSEADIRHGIIMAGEQPNLAHKVQVASVQTLQARLQNEKHELPPADLVVVDECHRSISHQYRTLLENNYGDSRVIGLTATPARGDGTGLGVLYDDMVFAPGVGELTEQGYLVPTRYYAPSTPDLTGVQIRDGDYVESQLAEKMDQQELVGDVVSNWARLASDRQTIVFASSVAHSRHLAEQFQSIGVSAAHIDGETFKEEREDIIRRVSRGDIQVLMNCMVLTEGFDSPELSCIVLARPTKSLGLYFQMVGRVLRPAPWVGKEDTIVLDHSGACLEHGFVDDPIPWTLDTNEKVQDRKARQDRERDEPTQIQCRECSYVYKGKPECPNCGAVPPKKKDTPDIRDAELAEVDRNQRKPKKKEWTRRDKERWYQMLLGFAEEKGYKRGWAYHKYKKKVGEEPNGLDPVPRVPDKQVRSWVKSEFIRLHKGRQKARASQ